ncbi:extracellular solute-binding protein [Micromonospora sp. NRRL B-16802]|uniref:extracellular solute-binding protein n=1 Tax=unclassified Micromonospora TaxID=2617518 RepID=UPI0006AED383|nr:extracellular solute-binding protein [Micromonospora sp. NRRL B-16802]KOX03149.1 phosphate ABC transporter [Micromonospora sp. NRRL B-16802]
MSGRTVVEFWLHYYNTPHFLDQTREMAASFNARHPEYEVVVTGHDFHDLPRVVAEAADRGVAPAVAQIYLTATQEARDMVDTAGQPLFTSVTRAIAGRREILGEAVVLDDVLPRVRDFYTVDGDLASMPTLASTALLYANTTMLAAAGVTSVPSTWAEVAAACKSVAALPDGPEYAITWPNHGWIFQQAIAQQGGLLADHDNGRSGRARTVDLSSPEMLAFVGWWRQLHRDGYFLYTEDMDPSTCWGGTFMAFAEQRAALTVSSSVAAPHLVQAGRDGGFDVVAARLPHNEAAPYVGNLIGGDSLWLTAGLDPAVQDGALAFMQYLNSPRNAADRHRVSGYLPITLSAVDLLEREGWFAQNPHARVGVDQLAASGSSPAARGALFGDFGGMQDVNARAMHDVLLHDADPAERFTQATEEAQRLLDEYNAHCVAADGTRRNPPCLRVS